VNAFILYTLERWKKISNTNKKNTEPPYVINLKLSALQTISQGMLFQFCTFLLQKFTDLTILNSGGD